MDRKGTEGTQIIEHDWDRIKLPTDKYKISKTEIKIFRYKVIEEIDNGHQNHRYLA